MKKSKTIKFLQIFILLFVIGIIIVIYRNHTEGNAINCKDKDEDGCSKNYSYCEWRIDQEKVCNEEVRNENKIICKKWTMADSSKCVNKN
jgi:hypothetical protein